MQNLEFALWNAVLNGPREYGHGLISQAHIDSLRQLSKECGGWIYFDGQHEETFIPMLKWEKMFAREIGGKMID